MDVEAAVRHYARNYGPKAASQLKWFSSRPTLEEAIADAALGLDPEGKRHPHQRRLKREVLERAKRRLLATRDRIAASSSFEEILSIVEDLAERTHGLGKLYAYDTALRIGAKVGKLPEKVYLHAGTRKGAKRLGLDGKARALDMRSLPDPLRELKPYEVEDVLCIYKDRLPARYQ